MSKVAAVPPSMINSPLLRDLAERLGLQLEEAQPRPEPVPDTSPCSYPIDWTKPLVWVTGGYTGKPVKHFEPIEPGDAGYEAGGRWNCDGWWMKPDGTHVWYGSEIVVSNLEPETQPIDWTKPIEFIDGTPATIRSIGDHSVDIMVEDRRPETMTAVAGRLWKGGPTITDVAVVLMDDGSYPLRLGKPVVRNRK